MAKKSAPKSAPKSKPKTTTKPKPKASPKQPAAKKEVRYRDAKTGHYVTEEYAKKNPGTTVKETD